MIVSVTSNQSLMHLYLRITVYLGIEASTLTSSLTETLTSNRHSIFEAAESECQNKNPRRKIYGYQGSPKNVESMNGTDAAARSILVQLRQDGYLVRLDWVSQAVDFLSCSDSFNAANSILYKRVSDLLLLSDLREVVESSSAADRRLPDDIANLHNVRLFTDHTIVLQIEDARNISISSQCYANSATDVMRVSEDSASVIGNRDVNDFDEAVVSSSSDGLTEVRVWNSRSVIKLWLTDGVNTAVAYDANGILYSQIPRDLTQAPNVLQKLQGAKMRVSMLLVLHGVCWLAPNSVNLLGGVMLSSKLERPSQPHGGMEGRHHSAPHQSDEKNHDPAGSQNRGSRRSGGDSMSSRANVRALANVRASFNVAMDLIPLNVADQVPLVQHTSVSETAAVNYSGGAAAFGDPRCRIQIYADDAAEQSCGGVPPCCSGNPRTDRCFDASHGRTMHGRDGSVADTATIHSVAKGRVPGFVDSDEGGASTVSRRAASSSSEAWTLLIRDAAVTYQCEYVDRLRDIGSRTTPFLIRGFASSIRQIAYSEPAAKSLTEPSLRAPLDSNIEEISSGSGISRLVVELDDGDESVSATVSGKVCTKILSRGKLEGQVTNIFEWVDSLDAEESYRKLVRLLRIGLHGLFVIQRNAKNDDDNREYNERSVWDRNAELDTRVIDIVMNDGQDVSDLAKCGETRQSADVICSQLSTKPFLLRVISDELKRLAVTRGFKFDH